MKKVLFILASMFLISCSSSDKTNMAANPDHQCVYKKDYKGCKEKLNYFNRYNDHKKFKNLWSLVCAKRSFRAKCRSEKILERDIASKVQKAKKEIHFRFNSETASQRIYFMRKR